MSKIKKRIFVEKKKGFRVEATDLQKDINRDLNLNIENLRIVLTYDAFDIEEKILEQAKQTVFSEAMVDEVYPDIDLSNLSYIALETLPGQYDQRADSAMQCIKLLDPSSTCKITTGKIIIVEDEISDDDLERISKYCINPIETRVKDLSVLTIDQNVDVKPLEVFNDFITLDNTSLKDFISKHGLAMSIDDLTMVQDYFKNEEKRNPSETEIRVLDTYWSDHCRHTTFETCLNSIEFSSDRFNDQIKEAYDLYLDMRTKCKRENKPITLMDMATINSRYLRNKGELKEVEISDEINACSVFIDVDHNGAKEKWLLQFKNETHNHPTEIEPFGGASTCIGGAIRDPLSGRAYVYQATRISGSGDVFTPLDKTLSGKLPQSIISKKSAHGNSSYGNQIGLPTTYVREIYHPNYVAKHMELGAVVGATEAKNVVRLTPDDNDVVILLGGRTGRDGIGGATGSSKEHNVKSLDTCASEVQKGNAPEERKIQRLFRNPEVAQMIKKCNDFGAGGVCVAIGELADGLNIHLEKVRVKYAGLNATEIAISESQERMAVVVTKENANKFIELASKENLEAYEVAEVTNTNRLVMKLNDEVVVDINRDFLNTSGARQVTDVKVTTSRADNPFKDKKVNKEKILNTLGEVNVASQKGLVEMFDASIGSTTVMMPWGGKTQMTPTQVSVQKIPVLDGNTKTCSILAYGFNPYIMEYSCFAGAMYSVLESIAKTVAVGGKVNKIHFSFQEFFERLNLEKERWGRVTEAMLGGIKVLDYFNLAAIGGKDSMSGTFNDISVPPTLVSFACSDGNVDNIITPELKNIDSQLGVFLPMIDSDGYPDLESYKNIFAEVEKLIAEKKIASAYVVEEGGIITSLMKMSFGNSIGFEVNTDLNLLRLNMGAIVVETKEELDSKYYHHLGKTIEDKYIVNNEEINFEEALNAYTSTFAQLYPTSAPNSTQVVMSENFKVNNKVKAKNLIDTPKVLIPVFPGTNCEYDTARAFEKEGAKAKILVFKNQSEKDIFDSIDELVNELKDTQILAIPGGFSSGDEPDGSAKFIVNVLQNEKVKEAIHKLIDNDGLVLGICNGFQALIKSGLLPYGNIQTLNGDDATLFRNNINRHISTMAHTRLSSNASPWLQGLEVGSSYMIAVSHGEGKFVVSKDELDELIRNGQIAFQYCDEFDEATNDPNYNINGSSYAIEGIVSKDGHILGKMGHSERYYDDVFKNIYGNKKQNIFACGVNYFKKEN